MLKSVSKVVAVSLLAVQGVQADTIQWGDPIDTTSPAQLIGGSVLWAVNGGPSVTVNNAGPSGQATYVFEAGSYNSFDFVPATTSKAFNKAGATSSGNAGFDALLGGFTFATSGLATGIQTIEGLTPGATYQVQLFFNDQRDLSTDRAMSFSDGSGQIVSISAQGAGWGQHVVGTFIASGPTQEISHTTNGFNNVHLTAMLVTEIAAPGNADITWDAPTDTVGPEQLISGEVVLAVNGGPAVTVLNGGANGTQTVDFASATHASLDFEPATSAQHYILPGPAPDTGDAGFDTLLSGFSYATSGLPSAEQTISGLTPGREYTVQVFYRDNRPNLNTRTMTFDGVGLKAAGLGQNVVGRFVATDTEQTITHATSGFKNIHLTAMLVTEAVTGPAAVVHGDLFTRRKTYDVFPTFDMAVTGFDASDLVVSGGSVVDFEGEGRYYTATVAVDAAAQSVQVTVPSGSAVDATTGDLSLASNTLITENLAPTGPQWIIDDQSSWTAAAETSTNVDISDGALTPTAATGVYGSQVQGFGSLRKATHLTLEQVPVWDNWSPISNVGPSAARDAVVLLPVADDQYYLLGRYLSAQSYHAWFSSDMENWFYRGQVVPDGDGRWVTSADIIDGVTYIYSDVPNDQNPHVFIDDNLDDGIPGIAGGAVLVKDPCGSDSSFFRNDSDGLMHVIYEEWSPINARQNSWDSPLAGHASSADGVNGFVHHEHRPAVDVRTTPTGVTQTYSHPQIGTCSYEVHEPAQDAFGDWTTIKVGEQYYMFGDFDSHDGGIRVGRFTSSSIFRQFEFVGELGAGHPDPTVGFAEGQFYLVTQQSTDYVSPGPWVDGVEARAGVDVDGDGVVDQWADWQSVAESYALKEGYARVVEATPAALDLSELPAGRGFAFQIRLDNGAAPVTPMIDRVTLQFE